MSTLTPERIGAFIEYTLRPLTGDIREILDALKMLSPPLSERLIRQACVGVLLAHLAGELLRAITYITVTGVVCWTAFQLLPFLQ